MHDARAFACVCMCGASHRFLAAEGHRAAREKYKGPTAFVPLLVCMRAVHAPYVRSCTVLYTRNKMTCTYAPLLPPTPKKNTYTHPGRSRNDQVATDVRLYLREEAQRIQVMNDLKGGGERG